MNTAKRSLQGQFRIFVISLSNDLGNKEKHGNAHTVFQMPTLCLHLSPATERPDAPLLRQAVLERQAGSSPSCQGWLWSWQGQDPAKPTLTDDFWVPADLWSLLAWSGTKELVHQGPSQVYLTKAAIAYILINVFALHAAGGGPWSPHAAVQVSTSLPSLYITQNKSRKSTVRHIKRTTAGKDNFCHWCKKLLRLVMMPWALSLWTQKSVESFCH